VEKVGSRPVEHRHEIVADNLDAELLKVFKRLLVIFNIAVTRRKPYFDIVMDIYTLNDIRIKAIGLNLIYHLFYLIRFPYLSGLLVVKRPHDSVNSRNLTDLAEGNGIVALAVPAKSHLHLYTSSNEYEILKYI
jgi:hypothetical protein